VGDLGCFGRGLGFGFHVVGVVRVRVVVWDVGGGVGCACVSVCVVEDGGPEVGHGACGPPGVAQAVQENDALLEFVGGTVDVYFQAALAEVSIYYA